MKTIGEDIETYAKLVGIYDKYVEDVKPTVYFLGLIGEVSELCAAISSIDGIGDKEAEWKQKWIDECGDIMWYWTALANELKIDYAKIWNLIYSENQEKQIEDYTQVDSLEILNIVASAGRITEHLKKSIRDDGGKITPERLQKIEEKMAETLQNLMSFCNSINVDPYQVLQRNYDKLFARNEAGTLQGEGDGISKEERT